MPLEKEGRGRFQGPHPHHRRLCLPRKARDTLINPLVPKRDGWTPRGPLATSTDVFGRHKWAVDATAIHWVRPGMLLFILQYIGWSPQQRVIQTQMSTVPMLKNPGLYVESKKMVQNGNRVTDVENKLMVTKGERGREG